MSEFTAYLNDYDLSELFVIAPPERNLVTIEPILFDGPSIGVINGGRKVQPMEISLELTTFAPTLKERLAALGALNSRLTGARWLKLSDETATVNNDTYMLQRYIIPTGTPEVTHVYNAATAKVTFVCPDVVKHGRSNSVTLRTDTASYGQYIGRIGNANTDPTIVFNGVTGDANGQFVFQMHTIRGLSDIKLDVGTGNAVDIRIVSSMRNYYIDDNETMFPLGSDWPVLSGGDNFKLISGSFTGGTVTFEDRWW